MAWQVRAGQGRAGQGRAGQGEEAVGGRNCRELGFGTKWIQALGSNAVGLEITILR